MNEQQGWGAVAEATQSAKAIAFDGCHKIYLAMDDDQVRQFASYGYGEDDDGSLLLKADEIGSPEEMFLIIESWYEHSCFLKFVNAVYTNEEDPNAGFVQVIPQGWDEDEDEDE